MVLMVGINMCSEYKRGYNFERRVRKYLEGLGYTVFRAAGSKPIDLIVFTHGAGFILECKVSKKYLRKENVERMLKIHEKTGLIPVFAYRDKDKKIRFLNLLTNKEMLFPHVNSLDKYVSL